MPYTIALCPRPIYRKSACFEDLTLSSTFDTAQHLLSKAFSGTLVMLRAIEAPSRQGKTTVLRNEAAPAASSDANIAKSPEHPKGTSCNELLRILIKESKRRCITPDASQHIIAQKLRPTGQMPSLIPHASVQQPGLSVRFNGQQAV
jgi:hypothetical protein